MDLRRHSGGPDPTQRSRAALHQLFMLKGHFLGSCPRQVTAMPGADAETYLPTAGERVSTGQCGVFAFCNRCPVCGAPLDSARLSPARVEQKFGGC